MNSVFETIKLMLCILSLDPIVRMSQTNFQGQEESDQFFQSVLENVAKDLRNIYKNVLFFFQVSLSIVLDPSLHTMKQRRWRERRRRKAAATTFSMTYEAMEDDVSIFHL